MNHRVLVTGAYGQLGQSFRSLTGYAESLGLVLFFAGRAELDITNIESIDLYLRQNKIDAVVNTAAYTAVDNAESEPEQARIINTDAAGFLAKSCADNGCWLVHVSTDYVFDGSSSGRYDESAVVNPLGVYGETKLAGEYAVMQYLPQALILRTSWVFSEFGQNFLKTMLRLGQLRSELSIVADQYGAPTYAPHIAEVILRLLHLHLQGKLPELGVCHFCGQPDSTWYEFANVIFKTLVKYDPSFKLPEIKPVGTSDYQTVAKRPANSRLDITKLLSILDDINCDWHEGVERAIISLIEERHVG